MWNISDAKLKAAGSAAEKIYREAKDVLRRIVSDDMTDYEKLKAIYNFLTCEVRYDRATADDGGGEAYRAQCYYLEGVFFNRFAVCDGKAKAYCLLAAMEGIEAVRVTDFNDDFQGHSYNYVNLNGKWYLSCATYGSAEMNFGDEENPDVKIVPQYNMFLTSLDTSLGDGWTYDSGMFPEIKAAFEAGFTHAAHFYNAMPGFHKRREYKYEGTVESVYLIDDMSVEVIADGVHLPATILKLVYRLKGVERTCLVTDALKYAVYEGGTIDDPRYVIEDGVCKLADHQSLAGSIATMDRLVQTMVQKAGIPLADAVRMASETPARIMGIADHKGTLQKGKDADILILDKDVNVRCVFSYGKMVEGTNTMIH